MASRFQFGLKAIIGTTVIVALAAAAISQLARPDGDDWSVCCGVWAINLEIVAVSIVLIWITRNR